MADTAPFAAELRRLRDQRGLSIRSLAALIHHGKSYIHELETGQKPPTLAVARRLDDALGASGRLVELLRSVEDDTGSQVEAIELARRIAALVSADCGPNLPGHGQPFTPLSVIES